MRCTCCNRVLNDAESTARHPDSFLFLDTCFKCLREIGIAPLLRDEFDENEAVDEDDFLEEKEWLEEEDE